MITYFYFLSSMDIKKGLKLDYLSTVSVQHWPMVRIPLSKLLKYVKQCKYCL